MAHMSETRKHTLIQLREITFEESMACGRMSVHSVSVHAGAWDGVLTLYQKRAYR